MITDYAFIFMSPDADPDRDGVTIQTGGSRNRIYPVGDPATAPDVARAAVENGAQLIELCGIIDTETVGQVIAAVGDSVPVGVVRYGPESVPLLAKAM